MSMSVKVKIIICILFMTMSEWLNISDMRFDIFCYFSILLTWLKKVEKKYRQMVKVIICLYNIFFRISFAFHIFYLMNDNYCNLIINIIGYTKDSKKDIQCLDTMTRFEHWYDFDSTFSLYSLLLRTRFLERIIVLFLIPIVIFFYWYLSKTEKC